MNNERLSSLERSIFIRKIAQASIFGAIGATLGAGCETLRQAKTSTKEVQSRRELLQSINLKRILRAASIGGSAGLTVGLLKDRKPEA